MKSLAATGNRGRNRVDGRAYSLQLIAYSPFPYAIGSAEPASWNPLSRS